MLVRDARTSENCFWENNHRPEICVQHWRRMRNKHYFFEFHNFGGAPADNHDTTNGNMFLVNIDRAWPLTLTNVGPTSDCIRTTELKQNDVTRAC